ncbi:MAG: retroviral-like aspartic protease family protein [Candidatus Obscuribacterales bacterium]|nr:retroviral-like aspartic protease family protein [Candidatus Obscuribacterales bacterium]
MNMRTVLIILFAVSLVTAAIEAYADSGYTQGLIFYKAKNYRAAAEQFEKQLRAGPTDINCLYYCALSQQLSNNRARARQLYEYLVVNYPNSAVAKNANLALEQLALLNLSPTSTGATQPISSPAATLAGVPDEVRIPFERKGTHAYVDVLLNNHPVQMIFDTGAEITAIGDNHLQEIGLSRPETTEKMLLVGVGDNTKIRGWVQKFDLKVGPIYRRDFSITVQSDMPTPPLLGQTFFKDFQVTLDDAAKQIIFRKKYSMAAKDARRGQKPGVKVVPFVRSAGGSMYVNAIVNGKPYPMIFDTGAHGTLFTLGDFKALGFTVPADAEESQVKGIGGFTKSWTFNLRSLQVGPLMAENMPIAVSDSQEVGVPLLGQTFFGRFKYEIDNDKNVIYFSEQ